MNSYNYIDGMYLNYLQPLKKWRILDVENLRSELPTNPKYSNFCRVLRRLESQKILKLYKDPLSKKKYVYLTEFGEDKIGIDSIQSSISEGTLLHDLKVSEFVRSLSINSDQVETKLEHELKLNKSFNSKFNIIPDAVFFKENDGIRSSIAFELEISKKSTDRILGKLSDYISSKQYDIVLYVFGNINLMNSYYQKINNHFKQDVSERVIFYLWDKLQIDNINFNQNSGIFNNKKVSLKEIFSG